MTLGDTEVVIGVATTIITALSLFVVKLKATVEDMKDMVHRDLRHVVIGVSPVVPRVLKFEGVSFARSFRHSRHLSKTSPVVIYHLPAHYARKVDYYIICGDELGSNVIRYDNDDALAALSADESISVKRVKTFFNQGGVGCNAKQ